MTWSCNKRSSDQMTTNHKPLLSIIPQKRQRRGSTIPNRDKDVWTATAPNLCHVLFASPSYCSHFSLDTEQLSPGIRRGGRKASSAQCSNSTDLRISLVVSGIWERPCQYKYSIAPTWGIFDMMKLVRFLSRTSPLCNAKDAGKKVHRVEIENSDLDVV